MRARNVTRRGNVRALVFLQRLRPAPAEREAGMPSYMLIFWASKAHGGRVEVRPVMHIDASD
jgi:hypothetical protein